MWVLIMFIFVIFCTFENVYINKYLVKFLYSMLKSLFSYNKSFDVNSV